MRSSFSILAILLLTGAVAAQGGDFSFAHGIPGLPGPVDVTANGTTVFSGVTYGALQSTALMPGSYTIDVSSSGTTLLSASATIVANESVTVAAHLLSGGASNLSVIQNDLSAVGVAGKGRITLHHLADAEVLLWGVEGTTSLNLSALPQNGFSFPIEPDPDTYAVQAAPITPASGIPFPFPPSAQVASNLNLASDAGLEIYIVGTPGTNSFTAIVQNLTLTPAVPFVPLPCTLTLSGSLVGGSLTTGGDLTFAVTGASPNSTVAIFLALDNNPVTVFDIPLGIGGSGGLDVVAFGQADGNGDFSQTLVIPGAPVVNPLGQSGPPTPFDFFVQGASVEFAGGNNLVTCVSNVQVLQVSIP